MNKETWEENFKTRALINEMLGETTGIFMSEELRGVDIVMPTHKLDKIIEKYLPLILTSHNQSLIEGVDKLEVLIEGDPENRIEYVSKREVINLIKSKQCEKASH